MIEKIQFLFLKHDPIEILQKHEIRHHHQKQRWSGNDVVNRHRGEIEWSPNSAAKNGDKTKKIKQRENPCLNSEFALKSDTFKIFCAERDLTADSTSSAPVANIAPADRIQMIRIRNRISKGKIKRLPLHHPINVISYLLSGKLMPEASFVIS
ncbi:hypothetical protein GQR58_023762 [Nymphon striatum]|nr:hypothetical protein GQR58_023762 [Nymphon striatum]